MSTQAVRKPAEQVRPGQHALIYGTWRQVSDVRTTTATGAPSAHVVIMDSTGGILRTLARTMIPVAETPPPGPRQRLDALGRITELERQRRQLLDQLTEVEHAQAEQITRAREAGALWRTIARALGTTISNAHRRHHRNTQPERSEP